DAATIGACAARLQVTVRRLAGGAHSPRSHASYDLLVRHLEGDDRVHLAAERFEHRPEAVSLRNGANDPVEDDASGVFRLRQLFTNDPEDDRIGHEIAAIHVSLRLTTERRTLLHRCTEDVPRRQCRYTQRLGDLGSLCALSGAGLYEQHDVHSGANASSEGQSRY